MKSVDPKHFETHITYAQKSSSIAGAYKLQYKSTTFVVFRKWPTWAWNTFQFDPDKSRYKKTNLFYGNIKDTIWCNNY